MAVKPEKYDFSGYASKYGVKCSDGRTILKDAFKHQDGERLPLVWQHQHKSPTNVLGWAHIEHRDDGPYAYCEFNSNEFSQECKELVSHGDIKSLSIYANQLTEKVKHVAHGMMREVSLVLAGANTEAYIDNVVLQHDDGNLTTIPEEAIIHTGGEILLKTEDAVQHSETVEEVPVVEEQKKETEEVIEHALPADATIQDVWDTFTQEQKDVASFFVAKALETSGSEMSQSNEQEGENVMKTNAFDTAIAETKALVHADMLTIFESAKRSGSLKLAVQDYALAHSITDIDMFFPEAKAERREPDLIARRMEWVARVLSQVHHTPFARVKSMAANLTAEEARARGYIKGNKKKEEVITLLKRAVTPQTIYKLQKLDRDDVIDITDFDIVAWIKREMRVMLDEEIARAILIGDGRDAASEDKIQPIHIIPIASDADLYNVKVLIPDGADVAAIQDIIIRSRVLYKGSGNPTLFTTTDSFMDLLLVRDSIGRRLYNTTNELSAGLGVGAIMDVEVLTGATITTEADAPGSANPIPAGTYDVVGIMVNLRDYTVGADRGGQVAMFDDFDIDYNKYTYLIETRLSGALTRPYSAVTFVKAHTEG